MTTVTSNGFTTITMWTVYDRDPACSYEFVAREYAILPDGVKPTSKTFADRDLSVVRKFLSDLELERCDRDRNDEPSVLETWI